MSSKNTAVMRQFLAAKAAHPDAVIFFRLGDFYELFFEDAVQFAPILELTLTSRDKGSVDPVPMAGVPHHSAHQHIAKLLALGHKVALCEQLADPSKTKGLVPREVVRVLTPGLVTDLDQLEARENAYLAAVHEDGSDLGLALLDLSTGELGATTLDGGALLGELVRAHPREVLCEFDATRASVAAALPSVPVREDAPLSDVRTELEAVVGADETERALGSLRPAALAAAARALRFARRASPLLPVPVRRIDGWDTTRQLSLDDTAQRHLELVASTTGGARGSLLALVDETKTAAGARLLRRRLLAPLCEVTPIRRRHDAIEHLASEQRTRREARDALAKVADVERLSVRAALGEASPKDLGALRDTLAALPALEGALRSAPDPNDVLELDARPLDRLPELAARLSTVLADTLPVAAREGGVFARGVSRELDELCELQRSGAAHIAGLEGRLRTETAISNLKVKFTRVFGWYIEVTGRHLDKVPSSWRRKQTVAGAERFTTDELDDLSDRLLHAEDRAKELESSLFRELLREIATYGARLSGLAARIAAWDVAAALAEAAQAHGWSRPEIVEGPVLELVDARHPVVEALVPAGSYVPNDVALDADGERLWLVTGPNMAGKSTLMRMTAQLVILAQMGSFVPARSARVGLVDRILSRVGASDNLSRGESTFMVEMRETSSILRAATRRSLVILDEIGRGTSTYDGLAIAWAVTEHLHDKAACRALFATHYHELTELADQLPHAANASVSAKELRGDVVFLHKLTRGAASKSYGVAVAKLAGLPRSVLHRAEEILAGLERDGALPTGTRKPRHETPQLDLFSAVAEHPFVTELRALEPDAMTPLEALATLTRWKAEL